jgi:hypothetical protein
MRRLHADRGDNPDPGTEHKSTCSKKIIDGQCAIRQRTQFGRTNPIPQNEAKLQQFEQLIRFVSTRTAGNRVCAV